MLALQVFLRTSPPATPHDPICELSLFCELCFCSNFTNVFALQKSNRDIKMIFLSHNFHDKPLVRQIAETLEQRYGKDKVFYDEWSIQPGDSFIQKMDEGLSGCKYFFFFISENSLKSKMVELEWQSALVKKVRENIKFIPVKIDKCIIPQILTHTLYVDLFSQGLEVAKRQIMDVINGENTYQNNENKFHNIIGYISQEAKKVIVEFRAEYYMEPHSKYLILIDNNEEDLDYKGLGMTFSPSFLKEIKLDNGENYRGAIHISRPEATSPGFPFIVELTQKMEKEIKVLELMKAVSKDKYEMIPLKINDSQK